MGCCISRPWGDPNSPYPGAAIATSSSHPINRETSNRPSSAQRQRTPSSAINHHPLDQHITKPLRRHKWTSKDRTWTRCQLTHERIDFFDTRVTGRPEIWQTIHVALQMLWYDERQGSDSENLATAGTILSAAELLLPTGNLADGLYDSLGNFYFLPAWVVCDPTNIVADEPRPREGVKNETATADDVKSDPDETEEKGKVIVNISEQVTVRARLSENGRDYQVSAHKDDAIRAITRKIAEVTRLAPDKSLRIAYMGRILEESQSLEAQGWKPGHIINAMAFELQS